MTNTDTLEERLEARLLGHFVSKKEIIRAILNETEYPGYISCKELKAVHERGCDDRFEIDLEIFEGTDAYIEIWFEHTPQSVLYLITEVDVEINNWKE